MTILECVNEKIALNLNPFQVFVFLNEKTKRFEKQLRALADRQRSFHFVFIDDDPRSHIQTNLPETMDLQFYTIVMNSDIVARVMPKWAGDYRYLTEILSANDDWDTIEKTIKNVIKKLRNEQYLSKINTLRRYFQYGNSSFVDFLNDIYNGDLQKLVNMSHIYLNMRCTRSVKRAELFAYKFFESLNEDQLNTINQIMKETLDYASEEDSLLIFDDYTHYQSEEGSDNCHYISKPTFKIVISPEHKKKIDLGGQYAITIVTDKNQQHNMVFRNKGAKMIYLLTLLCQTKIGGLPTNYFKTDDSLDIIVKIYNKLYRSGGIEWAEKLRDKEHNIAMYRTHASGSIKKDMWMGKNIAYWSDFENTEVILGHRKVKLRSIRLPKENIIIQDDPNDPEPLSRMVENMPPLYTLFGLRNRKAYRILDKVDEINKNLALAKDNPNVVYEDISTSEDGKADYLE